MHAPSTSTITLLILLPLLGWRIYARIRRLVGRQRLSKVRPWITLTIFPILIVLLMLAARAHPERLALFAGSLVGGVALGVFGFRTTQLEPTSQGLFYTPNAHLGIALSLLLIGRNVYRFIEVFLVEPHVPHDMEDFGRSPITPGGSAWWPVLARPSTPTSCRTGDAAWPFRALKSSQCPLPTRRGPRSFIGTCSGLS